MLQTSVVPEPAWSLTGPALPGLSPGCDLKWWETTWDFPNLPPPLGWLPASTSITPVGTSCAWFWSPGALGF